MIRPHLLLWSAAAVLFASGTVRIEATLRRMDAGVPTRGDVPRPARSASTAPDWNVPDVLDTLTGRNLFHPYRGAVREEEEGAEFVVQSSYEPKPMLLLRGVVGGPPWSAIVEGIPERPGPVILSQRDTISGLTIRTVRNDTVFIRGRDTTWTLTLAGP